MIKAAVFDLDGTLLNTLGALTWCTNQVLLSFGMKEIREEDTRKIVGDGYIMQMTRALRLRGDDQLTHLEEAKKRYMAVFAANCMREVRPYDGIPELLEFLKKNSVKIACFSNKPDAQAVENIETIFGRGYFDAVRGERAGFPKKPDPAGALAIAGEFGVSPEECIYLGDTNTDMKTGTSAGMKTIGVLWGYRDKAELAAFHPCLLAGKPADVAAYLTADTGKCKNEGC